MLKTNQLLANWYRRLFFEEAKMSRVVVLTDSAVDFPAGALNGRRIKVVSFYATPDGLLRAYKKAGPKILFLRASTKLSGTLQSAERAREKVPFHFEVKILNS